jgi:hypothetical protein
MVLGHPSRSALSTPPIASSRISAQPTTRHRLRGELGGRGTTTSRTTTREANERSPRSRTLVMQSSAPAPGSQSTWDSALGYSSISQCPFLQMTYTAENPYADGNAAPGACPRPSRHAPHTTIGCRQDRRPVVSKRPLHSHAAAKMSQDIRIGPEPVLAAHARPPPAAGSHSLAGADSAPHSEGSLTHANVPFTSRGNVTLVLKTVFKK